ncbi:TPA: DUF551 domain-containing protein [Escherichia coli]|uniref:DUF551 domain-containing protein n=1 Tax=Escherichia coli TaxID=562 RepID=UPI0015C54D63|nr:DUF551 domain-containing protein [Escherichia coli]MCK2307795.1 DUF551 domain-containing protein [Escherichia coli]MCV8052923.1 DUF551 domain-containing protein [Escherichia coli]MDF9103172.1 DUF551 domain-containing protein [Escherichia coli]HAN6310971.1 DUF551 domain-containing protein [Escherichia coli]HAW3841129.1 DUF551 domain-containing protein [Escherichia coli]
MSTITREWLQQAINDYESVRDELPFGLDDYQGNILAALRIALASLEAEPVAWKVTFTQIDREYNTFTGMYSDKAEVERWVRLHKACNFRADITPLYTAQPVPVTPDGWVMVPKELTPEMMRAVQIRSELGGYATSNLSGAYNMFSEFWNVAVSAAPKVDDL